MTILQALDRYYDRMARRGEAPPLGYVAQQVKGEILLSPAGEVVALHALGDDSRGGKNAFVPEPITEPSARTSQAVVPYFLADNPSYILGRKQGDARVQRKFESSASFHAKLLSDTTDPALQALLSYFQRYLSESDRAWNLPFQDGVVVFRLDGQHEYLHEKPDAQKRWAAYLAGLPLDQAMCLVSGQESGITRLHYKVNGFRDADSLVSFNLESSRSYGKDQGDNAPTSKTAAFRYGAALNRMLERSGRNRLKGSVGDATVVFWADAENEECANAAELAFSSIFEPIEGSGTGGDEQLPRDLDEAARLRDALQDFAAGRAVAAPTLQLARGVRFHVLGLSPNAARLSVRFWVSDSFDAFAMRLAEHAADLTIDPKPWRNGSPPSVQRLLAKTTALQEKSDNIPPLLVGEVTRAVLTGAPYPRTLMSAALMRLRAGDDPASGWHAAAIRAVLARLNRFGFESEEPPMALDPDNPNVAYQLGRLFAVYERAQETALGNVNATIRDKYYGAASATPALVFPLIDRGAQNHLAKVRKDKPGLSHWYEQTIGEIVNKIDRDFPRSLKLEDQGRFALGYYHQRFAKSDKTQSSVPQEGQD